MSDVSHPYDIPHGVGRGRITGDPVLILCATVIVISILAAVVALTVTNHSAEVARYASVIVPTFTTLVALFGLGKRTGDVHAQSQATYLRLNGTLDTRIKSAVASALNDHAATSQVHVSPDTIRGAAPKPGD